MSFNVSGVFVTLQTVVCQASLSIGFSRQEYWSRLPCPSPGDLHDPGTKPRSPALQEDSSPSEPPGKLENKIFIPVVELWHTLNQSHQSLFRDSIYTNEIKNLVTMSLSHWKTMSIVSAMQYWRFPRWVCGIALHAAFTVNSSNNTFRLNRIWHL